MKKIEYNSMRRNRNIDTERNGYGQNNKFVIPEPFHDMLCYWERLNNPLIFPLKINGHQIVLFIEPTRNDCVHACTPEDIITILNLVNRKHLQQIELFVLRQPKRKQEIIRPVWGRFAYYANLGKYEGPAIILEATPLNHVLHWKKNIDPYEAKELEALKKDGHKIEKSRRGYRIHTTIETVRNTQLYRTIPHEIGHAVDYLENCMVPSINAETEEQKNYISRIFEAKNPLDKEEFANRYARNFYEKWSQKGMLPFSKKDNLSCLEKKFHRWFKN
ncbi:hypothetical protein [Candidatus Uabimicrobium sp. HlEnr_7]|uniref:hypothetical protein n=1 Tax=Candidatus Uabimicrobium helgolandensis TaxID=3095367 RepID=UPI0035578B8F